MGMKERRGVEYHGMITSVAQIPLRVPFSRVFAQGGHAGCNPAVSDTIGSIPIRRIEFGEMA